MLHLPKNCGEPSGAGLTSTPSAGGGGGWGFSAAGIQRGGSLQQAAAQAGGPDKQVNFR